MPKKAAVSETNTMQQPQAAAGGTRIYLGPPIYGVVTTGRVFTDGLTPQLAELAAELPAIRMLLIPVERAAAARKELQNKESAISIGYQAVAAYVEQKGR